MLVREVGGTVDTTPGFAEGALLLVVNVKEGEEANQRGEASVILV